MIQQQLQIFLNYYQRMEISSPKKRVNRDKCVFHDKTAYVGGLRYRWDPLLSRNLIPRFPYFKPPCTEYTSRQNPTVGGKANTIIFYLAYALAIGRGSHWLWEEFTQLGKVHLFFTSLKDEQTCGINGKRLFERESIRRCKIHGNPGKPMWRTFECLQVAGRGRDTPRPTSFPLHLPPNPFPSAARHQIITTCFTTEDGGGGASDGGEVRSRDGGRAMAMAAPF